jgi:predicted pyridoxine 5'-phosphate oxidase superfamily flavin-nucleotide-binding protein
MYHEGNRHLQQQFGSAALADRLLEVTHHTKFTDPDKAFIAESSFFFLATATAEGQPDCSFKGGPAGFVHVTGESELVFPDYDGNGMFKSLGNIEVNPNVGLLFITMEASPRRLRVNGRAEIIRDSEQMNEFAGAQLLVRVTAEHIFPNCPRYIPDLKRGKASEYLPEQGKTAVEPEWKSFDLFEDVVPPRRR